jgi:hypothetical protein
MKKLMWGWLDVADGKDFKPAWKISPGVGLSCYLEKDARTPQKWALN